MTIKQDTLISKVYLENKDKVIAMKHETNGKTLNIAFKNDLIAATVDDYLEKVRAVFDSTKKGDIDSVIIDLSKVSYVDSLGLNFLVGLYKESQDLDCSFKTTGSSKQLITLFNFVKLADKFGIS